MDLSLEKGNLEKVCADMKLVNAICKGSHDLQVVLKSPIIKTDKKQSILKALFDSRVDKMTSGYLQLLAVKKRERYIEAIAEEFIEKYKEYKKIITAVITTAYGIDEDVRKSVQKLIKDSLKSEIELVEKVDKDLIGGFILRIGDKQDDTSILRKIRLLNRVFSENPYIKDY